MSGSSSTARLRNSRKCWKRSKNKNKNGKKTRKNTGKAQPVPAPPPQLPSSMNECCVTFLANTNRKKLPSWVKDAENEWWGPQAAPHQRSPATARTGQATPSVSDIMRPPGSVAAAPAWPPRRILTLSSHSGSSADLTVPGTAESGNSGEDDGDDDDFEMVVKQRRHRDESRKRRRDNLLIREELRREQVLLKQQVEEQAEMLARLQREVSEGSELQCCRCEV